MFKNSKVFTSVCVKFLILLSLVFLLSSCSTMKRLNRFGAPETTYKYVPVVEENVRFVVLPFNNYITQLEFAAKIENILLEAGLNLLAPPRGTKTIEERTGAGVSQRRVAGASSSSGRNNLKTVRIERYIASETIDAEYIVETMLKDSYGTIKFTRLRDHKIMSVITLTGSKSTFKKEIYKKLEAMHFISKVEVQAQGE